MKNFHEMTADEIAEHRAKWRKGEAEIWRGTTGRPSSTGPGPVYSDHDAPTKGLCVAAMSRAMAGVFGAGVVTQPEKVTPIGGPHFCPKQGGPAKGEPEDCPYCQGKFGP